jgi:flagellar FliJ protein
MKRFEFPLESVLRLRRFTEAQARQALQEALRVRNQAESALVATRARINTEMALLSERLTEMQAADVTQYWQELDALEELALKQRAYLVECESIVERRQDDYVAAQRERKPLERLREEMHRSHAHEADLVEQAMHDELAVQSHARKGAAP